MATQQELEAQQAQLKEEFVVHQAVQEVVHLLRREPRSAKVIVQLLKDHEEAEKTKARNVKFELRLIFPSATQFKGSILFRNLIRMALKSLCKMSNTTRGL